MDKKEMELISLRQLVQQRNDEINDLSETVITLKRKIEAMEFDLNRTDEIIGEAVSDTQSKNEKHIAMLEAVVIGADRAEAIEWIRDCVNGVVR